MNIKIQEDFYDDIKYRYRLYSSNWNGINNVMKMEGRSPEYNGVLIPGYNRETQTRMNDPIPYESRELKYNVYVEWKPDSIETYIPFNSWHIHSITNENRIRKHLNKLSNVTYKFIEQDVNNTPFLNQIGVNVGADTVKYAVQNTDNDYVKTLIEGDIKKFDDDITSGDVEDDIPLQYAYDYPYKTSKVDVNGYNVLTYDEDKGIELKESDKVEYNDYQEIVNVLNKIEKCLKKRDNWFDGNGRCQLSCQVSCQHTCQLACQGCNTKQCHDQKCGIH